MTTEDLFSSNTAEGQADKTSVPLFENEGKIPVVDPDKDWMSEYVGEGKKFKDAAALARGKAEADAFIYRLQQETDGLRKELSTRIKIEEFMDRMNSNQNGAGQSTQTDGDSSQSNGAATSANSTQDIEAIIEERLARKEAERRERENLEASKALLESSYGSNFAAELEKRTNELGLTKEFISNLAKTQPKALAALLGLDRQAAPQRDDGLFSPRSSVNTAGINGGSSGEKTWSYYEKMRKQNPGAYWSTQVQGEIHRAAAKLGEKFYT